MENISELNQKEYREFYSMSELHGLMIRNPFTSRIGQIVSSWGAGAWRNINNKLFRFKVNAHRHNGHVYIAVNGLDYFDVFLTTVRGRVIKEFKDVDISTLIETIDNEIERIPEYTD